MRRRIWVFVIVAIILAFAGFVVCAYLHVEPRLHQLATVREAKELGGIVIYSYSFDAQAKQIKPYSAFDEAVFPLDAIETIGGVTFKGVSSVPSTHLRALGRLPHLTKLALDGVKLSNAELEVLSRLESVRFLSLRDTQVNDSHIPLLARISSLIAIDLAGTKVTEDGKRRLLASLPECEIRDLQTRFPKGWRPRIDLGFGPIEIDMEALMEESADTQPPPLRDSDDH